jgi:glycosyltransferase involved in cell wall biosynthesis
MTNRIRVLSIVQGDVRRKPEFQVKYGFFFDALAHSFDMVDIYDSSLRGVSRYWGALRTFYPSIPRWRERFQRNVASFQARSAGVVRYLLSMQGKVDVVLQLGALFDSTINGNSCPVVLYTDNTTSITTRHIRPELLPFIGGELSNWLVHESRLYHRATHICVRSDAVKKSLLDDYNVQPERISVIGGGVNFASLPSLAEKQTNDGPVALFIGQNFYRKGGDIVMQAFARVLMKFPNAQLWVVTDGSMPAKLPRKNVYQISSNWNRDLIANLYRTADVFVMPSRHETWGDVLLEAMAFGLPCIGSQGQAMGEIIEHDRTGYLIAPEDVDGLSIYLAELFGNTDLRIRMGSAGRKKVSQGYTWEHVVKRLTPIIEAVGR